MIAEQLGMDKMVVHKIISEDLGMRKICAKLVPKVLTDVQKQNQRCCARRTDSQWCLLRGSVKKIEATDQTSKTRNFRQLEAPPQQCAVSHLLRDYRELDKKLHRNDSTAPTDFFLFPKVKTAFKGRHHGTLDDVKRARTHALKDALVRDFQGAYEAWKRRLQKCVHAQGAYFEDY
ncbi:uncharacterized protein TNCV_1584431 [Trichonephila clavipes]|nr:uncharacterized protein TNCV_1584431 [Trichonephila clavipes]